MDFDTVKLRVKDEFCEDTEYKLKDESLLGEYLKCQSVNKRITELRNVLEDSGIDSEKISNVVSRYIPMIIPPGTKGKIRGDVFNRLVKEKIESMELSVDEYTIRFEEKHPDVHTDEIPDWFITKGGKTIIGMNQVDLWNGGHQRNRGSKYLFDCRNNTENTKLLCVVANKPTFTSQNGVQFRMFKLGFENDTMCYVKNLPRIIKKFLN